MIVSSFCWVLVSSSSSSSDSSIDKSPKLYLFVSPILFYLIIKNFFFLLVSPLASLTAFTGSTYVSSFVMRISPVLSFKIGFFGSFLISVLTSLSSCSWFPLCSSCASSSSDLSSQSIIIFDNFMLFYAIFFYIYFVFLITF